MNPRSPLHKLNWLFLMVVVLMVLGYFGHLWPSDMVYRASTREPINYKPNRVKHIATPEPAKAVYMTSYVAGVKSWRGKILKLIDDTELNSLVIDIKDYTGMCGVTEKALHGLTPVLLMCGIILLVSLEIITRWDLMK